MIYIGLGIQACWGLLEVQSYIMEPIVAERKTRQFLQAFSLSLDDFSGPEFRKAPPNGFNTYVWRRQEGGQLLRVSALDFARNICVEYESPASSIGRAICLDYDHDVIDECFYRDGLSLGCQPLSLRIPGLMKSGEDM